MAESTSGDEKITSFAQVPAMEENLWQESLDIHNKRQAELGALRERQRKDAETTGQGAPPDNPQTRYVEMLSKEVAAKSASSSHEATLPLSKEKPKDETIYDYFTVSTQPVLEATPFFGIFPGSEDEQPIRIHSMPENSILEVNTKLGPRYFKESGALTSRLLKGRTPSSDHPKFIEFMLPAQKDTLVKEGWNVVRAYDLLPENKKL